MSWGYGMVHRMGTYRGTATVSSTLISGRLESLGIASKNFDIQCRLLPLQRFSMKTPLLHGAPSAYRLVFSKTVDTFFIGPACSWPLRRTPTPRGRTGVRLARPALALRSYFRSRRIAEIRGLGADQDLVRWQWVICLFISFATSQPQF